MSDELHEASMWCGVAVMSVIAALAVGFMLYVPDLTGVMLATVFVIYPVFALWMAWLNYDGPLYGEVSADA